MCLVKTPKLPPPEKAKEPTIIRNPYLDGADPNTRALRSGRSGLRIERGVARSAPPQLTLPTPSTPFQPSSSLAAKIIRPIADRVNGGFTA